MSTHTSLKAAPRARSGSGALKQFRREGWLPSVIYGRDTENMNLKVDYRTFKDLIAHSSSENIVVNLDIEGEGVRLAFLQDIQHDPLTGDALHADFLAINDKTEITAHIPATIIGEAPGVNAGGIIEQYVHAIEITCLPDSLPETIDVNVSNLELGDSLHLGDITYPSGVTPTHSAEVVVVHIGISGAGASEGADEAGEGGEASAETAGEAAGE